MHDLKTKIGIITGLAELIAISNPDMAEESQRDIATIRKAAFDILRLVEDADSLG